MNVISSNPCTWEGTGGFNMPTFQHFFSNFGGQEVNQEMLLCHGYACI